MQLAVVALVARFPGKLVQGLLSKGCLTFNTWLTHCVQLERL